MLLHQIFVKTAKKYGDRMAIVDRTTGRRLTYSRALIASLILKRKLARYDPGFIGIMLPTSAGSVLAIMASLMSGRIPVMLNYSTGAERNAQFAQGKCDFTTIITSKALLEKINCPQVDGMIFLEDIMETVSTLDKIIAAIQANLPYSILKKLLFNGSPERYSVVLFTSGSEKEPKAVPLTHHNILFNIEGFSSVFDFSQLKKVLCILPYFHVFGLNTNLWTPIYHGMTLVTYANPLEYKTVSQIVKEEECDMMIGTPSFFWGYLQKSEPGDFKTVKIAVAGADKCPESLRKAFKEKHGCVLYEGYGATETSPVVAVNTPENNRPGSVGKPLPNIEVKIENYETGEPCKPLEVGKILVKGESVMQGYLDDLEETSMRIRTGWYDTGDMGSFDAAGYLWHAGRLKRFVKVGGEMVSLVAVEEALGKILPEGIECCVVELPDAVKGAKIVVALSAEVNKKEIMNKLTKNLPSIAVPKQYLVVDELPKMGSGKIDFRSTTQIVQKMLHVKPTTSPSKKKTKVS